MVKKHLKKIAMPSTWHIERKDRTFTTRPNPGGHRLDMCIPLGTLLRELIKCAKTEREGKTVLCTKNILVDGKRRKERKFPVGIMDVVDIEEIKEYYRILLNKNGNLYAQPVKKEETASKLCRIRNKTILGKDKIQLNLSDGRNLLVKKDEGYKTGDTLVMSLPDQKIKNHLKLEKGASIYLIGGKNIGCAGTVEHADGNKITYRLSDEKQGKKHDTLKEYVFVVGKEKPIITLADEKQ